VSSSVRKHVAMMLDTYDRCAHRPAMVFATLPGERHEIGLLMSAMICASQGYKVHYLGTDLPPEEIAQFAREVGAIAVAISVVLLESTESVGTTRRPFERARLHRADLARRPGHRRAFTSRPATGVHRGAGPDRPRATARDAGGLRAAALARD
jgi:cobalamin-dependent methionine synthase I